MIEVHQLTKRYGDGLAVDNLSFSVEQGKVTGFLGPNGAGKSTTMRMIACLERPTSGQARIDGKRFDEFSQPLRKVGVVLGARVHSGRKISGHLLGLARSNRISSSRVNKVLEIVGLSGAANKRGKELSQGMQQRLDIAAALLGDPEVLLFDEPVNGLDPEGVLWVRELMKRLASEGRTVLVSSHLMAEMAVTADHLIVIGQGRLLADSPVDEFISRNSRSFVSVLTPEADDLCRVLVAEEILFEAGSGGAVHVFGCSAKAIGELAAKNQITVHELSSQTASLEEAFMQLTTNAVDYRPTQKV